MSTKTMHLPPRRNKRKERDDFDVIKPPPPKLARPNAPQAEFATKPEPPPPLSHKPNILLAGYLAREFLTRGTLFGQPWDPARAEPTMRSTPPRPADRTTEQPSRKRYEEVSSLLSSGGAHLPGIVNPTQLARFLHM